MLLRSTPFAADRAGFTGRAGTRGDRQSVVISSCQQGVPVRDERQPDVLSSLHHVLRHKLLQVRMTVA